MYSVQLDGLLNLVELSTRYLYCTKTATLALTQARIGGQKGVKWWWARMASSQAFNGPQTHFKRVLRTQGPASTDFRRKKRLKSVFRGSRFSPWYPLLRTEGFKNQDFENRGTGRGVPGYPDKQHAEKVLQAYQIRKVLLLYSHRAVKPVHYNSRTITNNPFNCNSSKQICTHR